jgi:hypothetical protein
MATSGYAGKVGWTVGRASWLDDPASLVNRYWRQIEQGQSFSGVILIGLWGDNPGAIGAQGPHGNRLRTGQPLTPPGEGFGNQKFVAFGETDSAATALHRARFAFWYYITGGKMGRPSNTDLSKLHGATPAERRRVFFWIMSKAPLNKIPFVSAHLKKSVEGRHYYTRALASFDPMQVEIEMLREVIGPMIRGAFSQTSARTTMARDSGSRARKGPAHREVADASPYLAGMRPGEIGPVPSGMGIATVTAGPNVQDLIRTGGGQFPAGQWQAAIIEVNAKVAAMFQEHVVALMEEGVHLRPPTGDLVKATRDPRNRYPQ